ncbi:LOW QUALITY PROTEIN: hypothetical protein CVT26_000904, partial [Gymnopilus dilepis]
SGSNAHNELFQYHLKPFHLTHLNLSTYHPFKASRSLVYTSYTLYGSTRTLAVDKKPAIDTIQAHHFDQYCPDSSTKKGQGLASPTRYQDDPTSRALPYIDPTALISKLQLPYTPDEWQIHLIQRILQGYDSIFCAGTGYGKSLISEGLAVLGGKGNCPLKALEHDQATGKDINALVINEDTTKTANLCKDVRTTAAMVYMLPEMALADSFHKLWKDSRFRSRLTAVVVDEAHCIDKWGGDDFRPLYRKLSTLRSYTGYEVPIVSCTDTARTPTFDLIWNTLGYGHRPFWGVDVGTDHPNLFHITRPYSDPKIPFLDVLSILPTVLNDDTASGDIPKTFFFDSEAVCREAVQSIRKVLPPHLRSCAHAFSSDLSEKAKRAAWDKFQDDIHRMLCATDAAGMGCNVSNMSCLLGSKSLSTASQRWGRCGRDGTTEAVCFLLLPKWAFRPIPAESVAHQHLERNRKSKKADETKKDTLQRANLDVKLENFINIGFSDLSMVIFFLCPVLIGLAFRLRAHLRDEFSPTTGLTACHTLNCGSGKPGFRSKKSSFEMTWFLTYKGNHEPGAAVIDAAPKFEPKTVRSESGTEQAILLNLFMSTSNSVEERLYISDCSKYCRSEPTRVSRSAYYRHAPYRNILPPMPAELVASHHGVPLPHSSATSAPSIPLLRPLDPQEGFSEPPRRRRRAEAVAAPTPGISTETGQDSESLGATEGFVETGNGGLDGLEGAHTSYSTNCLSTDCEEQATPDAPAAQLGKPPHSQHAPLPRPYEYTIPADFEPKIDDLRSALAFQRALENASLENEDLDEDNLYLLCNPPAAPLRCLIVNKDIYLHFERASDQTYKNIYKGISQDSPERNFLSHARVKRKLAELTGVYAIVNDMRPNSCIAYTDPFAVLEVCVYCQAPRYSQDQPGEQARQHFYTPPLGTLEDNPSTVKVEPEKSSWKQKSRDSNGAKSVKTEPPAAKVEIVEEGEENKKRHELSPPSEGRPEKRARPEIAEAEEGITSITATPVDPSPSPGTSSITESPGLHTGSTQTAPFNAVLQCFEHQAPSVNQIPQGSPRSPHAQPTPPVEDLISANLKATEDQTKEDNVVAQQDTEKGEIGGEKSQTPPPHPAVTVLLAPSMDVAPSSNTPVTPAAKGVSAQEVPAAPTAPRRIKGGFQFDPKNCCLACYLPRRITNTHNVCIFMNLFGAECLQKNPGAKPTKNDVKAMYDALSEEDKKVWKERRAAKLKEKKSHYHHAPYINVVPPMPAELVAARHGVPLPDFSATRAPSISLLRPLNPQEDALYLLRNSHVLLSIKLFVSLQTRPIRPTRNICKDISQDSLERNFMHYLHQPFCTAGGVRVLPSSSIFPRPALANNLASTFTLFLSVHNSILGAHAMKYREQLLEYNKTCDRMDCLMAYLRGDRRSSQKIWFSCLRAMVQNLM